MKERKKLCFCIALLWGLVCCSFFLNTESVPIKAGPQKNERPNWDAEVLRGPDHALRGHLAVFESPEVADWILAPSENAIGKWVVDTSGKLLYFASDEPGIYTICAAIVVENKPKIFSKTFYVEQHRPDPNPDPDPDPDREPSPPLPVPDPDQEDLKTYLKWRIEEISPRVADFSGEKRSVENCFQSILESVQRRTIRSAPALRSNLRSCFSNTLLSFSGDSRAEWSRLIDEISAQMEKRCKSDPDDFKRLHSIVQEIHAAFE